MEQYFIVVFSKIVSKLFIAKRGNMIVRPIIAIEQSKVCEL